MKHEIDALPQILLNKSFEYRISHAFTRNQLVDSTNEEWVELYEEKAI